MNRRFFTVGISLMSGVAFAFAFACDIGPSPASADQPLRIITADTDINQRRGGVVWLPEIAGTGTYSSGVKVIDGPFVLTDYVSYPSYGGALFLDATGSKECDVVANGGSADGSSPGSPRTSLRTDRPIVAGYPELLLVGAQFHGARMVVGPTEALCHILHNYDGSTFEPVWFNWWGFVPY